MIRCMLWLCLPILLAALSGPASFVLSQAGQRDKGGVYLVLDFSAQERLADDLSLYGARAIGPTIPLFSRMITVSENGWEALRKSGYILLPATALATICGVPLIETSGITRNQTS